MTSPMRFEQDLPALLADLYVGRIPDYRDDLLGQTARTTQRPAWTFLERWIPVDIATRRLPAAKIPWRTLAVALLILVLAAAALFVAAGSTRRVPPPFGPARNGPIAYGQSDAIYTRTTLDAPEHVLVGGPGRKVGFAGFSPDGTQLLYVETVGGDSFLMAANADGANPHRILPSPVHDFYSAWAPDGRMVAISDDADVGRTVSLIPLDGSAVKVVDLGGASPTDLAWRPPDGSELLVRASRIDGTVDFYRVRPDGTTIGQLHLPDAGVFGIDWDVSGPAWSPSGDRIAYNQVVAVPGIEGGGHFRIHLVNPDGTRDVALPPPAEGEVNEAWPVWSPDGRSIAAQRFVFGDPELGWLAVIPSDGSAPGHDILPRLRGVGGIVKTWSPDGTRLVAYTKDAGDTYSVDPATGQIQKMDWPAADLPDFQRLAL
jgi:WD40-like Beta Propeller Repeat